MRRSLALLPLVALAACQAPLATTPRATDGEPVAADGRIRLTVGESRALGGDYTITAIDATDSRCPVGVTCVWAGEAKVVVGPSHPLMRFRPDTLTLAPVRPGQRDSMTVGPYRVRLVALDPVPRANAPAPSTRTATFVVRR